MEIHRQIDCALQEAISLIVDSSGLQVCGQGEWHSQQHGEKTPKRWKKLHIGVDAQGRMVASTVTESHEQDPSQVPALLSQADCVIDRFVGDGISLLGDPNTRSVYGPIASHFRPRRHLLAVSAYRQEMRQRFQTWREITGMEMAA